MNEAAPAMDGHAAARVFTIPAGVSFVDALASSLLARHAGDDFALADTRILLPNRRSVRALEAAFARCSAGRPLLLPRIEPIGEIEEETLSGRIAKANDVFEIAPAIDDIARLLELMPLVGSFLRPQGGRGIGAAHLLKLAEALARWQDAMDLARCDPDRLDDLVPEEFADHWRDTLEFLKIVRDHWMKGVRERCLLSPARRRVMLLERLAADWRENPP
ncbi:MAG: double-strand break repair protein AddB, partial [Alphaproteobacteria bacterium]